MAILENFNVEVEDLTLGELYPTKKSMNDDMQNIANRGYCQPKEQYVFSSDYILKPKFVEHQIIGTFGNTTSEVCNTIFKQMYETDNIRHNFCLLKRPTNTDNDISVILRMWAYPYNPTTVAEYDETLPPDANIAIKDYKFVKSFNYNEYVIKPFFTYNKLDETGKLLSNYYEGESEYFRSLDGLREIVESNRNDIFINDVTFSCALWNKTSNEWDYKTHLIPMIYCFNEVNCILTFDTLFRPSSFSIESNRENETKGLTTSAAVRVKTHYYDYYEGSNRRTYASDLNMFKSYPEFTFEPFDLTNYVNGNTRIIQENDESVFLATQTYSTSSYIEYTFSKLYKPKFVYKRLAELGLYMSSRQGKSSGSYELFCGTTPPNELMNRADTYLGEMLEDGKTTGIFLRGTEIVNSKTPNKNGSNIDINYKPSFAPSNDDIIDKFQYGTQTSLNINQFISAYILDGVDLQNLSNEFKNPTNEIPTGDIPFENIISLKKYPFNVKNHTITFEPSNIILSKWDTNVSAAKINATQTIVNIGSFTIDRKYNNFLDYEPYTTCELFLPFADYVPINLNKCMGNTINIEMIWDIDGNIKYLILCDNLLIAEINANIASSQILTAINSGLKSLQDLQNTITIASGLTSVAGSAVAGSPVGIVSSTISTVSGVVNAVTNQNTNYSTQKGQSQSDVSQKTILDFVLHITRPIVKIPKNYASTVGYILNDTKVLSELSGFTVCDNVIINNINCLNNEKTEIKNLLETGVIL